MTIEPNDTILTAIDSELSSDNPEIFFANGSIGDNPDVASESDVDLFRVELKAGTTLTVDIDAQEIDSSLDSVLRLFDSSGNELAISDDTPAPGEELLVDSYLEFVADTSGTYYIGVSGYDNFSYDPSVAGGSYDYSTGDYTLEITGSYPNELRGTASDDLLNGTDETDLIFGLDGNDDILSFAGNDFVFAGRGDDLIDTGSGDDKVEAGEGNDVIFGRSGADSLWANDGVDVVFGGYGFDHIGGGDGDDRLFGNDGDDLINGGEDNDFIKGGRGFDTILGGSGNDRLYGDGGDDRINGGRGDDILVGIDSGENSSFTIDTLTGGIGSDVFLLGDINGIYYDDNDSTSSGESDYALITDYEVSEDTIQLHGSLDLYSLDLFASASGTTDAAIIYDPGSAERGEVIGFLQDVSPELAIGDLSLTFV